MNRLLPVPHKRLLASALLAALSCPTYAQAATPQATGSETSPAKAASTESATTPDSSPKDVKKLAAVTVTGIRYSLAQSALIKRTSQGVVDGIVAEDIGKFPDTNLAESLQRISGVSIDRSAIGEGSKVTVRGIGPDFNLVLLNGRQMPGASILDTGASGSRSFDFANLSSDAISEVDVFKTSRANIPTGGMGATIDIRTARPLDNPGQHGSVGLKLINDQSARNLPDSMKGNVLTPELSGIYSNTFDDGKFGIGFNGSYSKRDLGYSQVGVTSGWHNFQGDEGGWGAIPASGAPGSENITNRPGANDIYSVPQNLDYYVNGATRTRTNGQLVFQYAPTDSLTTTLDYTYAENKIQTRRNDLSVWFNFGPSTSSWTNGPIAAPNNYSETIDPVASPADLAMAGGEYGTRAKLQSLGLNQKWKATDNLNFEFDGHHSVATDGADSPYGSNATIGTADFVRGTTGVDFSGAFPVLNVELPPGETQLDPSKMLVTGASFRNSYMRSEVDQGQLKGDYTFADESRLDFGVGTTLVKNRSAYAYNEEDDWGGITGTTSADYPASLWHADNMGNYFGQFSQSGSPDFTDAFYTWNFDQARQAALAAWQKAGNAPFDFLAPKTFTYDSRVQERSKDAYAQWSKTWNWSMPFHAAVGLRYEKTTISSSALVPIVTGIQWQSANEFNTVTGPSGFTTLTGKYSYLLPNVDLSLDVTDNIIVRGSYSRTIGRPTWDQIQGGQSLAALVRVDGGTGSEGNPNLKPLVSDNFDLSFEWYYGDASYVSLGYFRKNIDNYIGTTQVNETPFDLHTPVGGAYWNEALTHGCAATDMVCIRDYIFANHNGDPGVTKTGTDSTGHATGTIAGQPGDPIASFRITTPANQESASLDGLELAWQQMFGNSGFGIAANYTYVHSGLTYDNYVIGQQFALVGLSDSANLVPFYDKGPWQIRVAYNWRGQFLSSLFDGAGANPIYVEPYGQVDFSVGYQFNKHLSAQLQGINVTDETMRSHSRAYNDLEYATQNGRRFMLGVNYKF
ncbi:MAG TPA: TonB-dependent receptor [Rhodanobacter sp.]|nr:TonB-dependent receptor [Rhodanobacter sp.]